MNPVTNAHGMEMTFICQYKWSCRAEKNSQNMDVIDNVPCFVH